MSELSKYRGKKVLITGHTGFKGYWLCKTLKLFGANIVGISDQYIFPENRSFIEKTVYSSYFIDILDREKVEAVIQKEKPDYIFHFAAQSLVRKSYDNPYLTWMVNLNGTLNVIDSTEKLLNPCVIICATTDKVYQNDGVTLKRFKETDPLGGDDPYSASKAACELLINSKNFCKRIDAEKRLLLRSVRAGNVVGGADWSEDRIVPDIIRAAINQKKLAIRNPNATRPWQHVIDCCVAYLKIGLYGGHYSNFNVGPSNDNVITVGEIVDQAKYNFDINLDVVMSKEKPEKLNLHLNTLLIKKELNFSPKIVGRNIFELTFAWYERFITQHECIAEEQIRNYFNEQF